MNKFSTRLSVLVSSGLGSGFSPIMPGTCGTIVCLAIWIAFVMSLPGSSPELSILIAAGVTIVGTFAVRTAMREGEVCDPQWIVVDEWAGMLWGLVAVAPNDWPRIAIAFVSFRVFDMWKPGPIGWAEQLPGPFGVMADDVVAGLVTALVVLVTLFLW